MSRVSMSSRNSSRKSSRKASRKSLRHSEKVPVTTPSATVFPPDRSATRPNALYASNRSTHTGFTGVSSTTAERFLAKRPRRSLVTFPVFGSIAATSAETLADGRGVRVQNHLRPDENREREPSRGSRSEPSFASPGRAGTPGGAGPRPGRARADRRRRDRRPRRVPRIRRRRSNRHRLLHRSCTTARTVANTPAGITKTFWPSRTLPASIFPPTAAGPSERLPPATTSDTGIRSGRGAPRSTGGNASIAPTSVGPSHTPRVQRWAPRSEARG